MTKKDKINKLLKNLDNHTLNHNEINNLIQRQNKTMNLLSKMSGKKIKPRTNISNNISKQIINCIAEIHGIKKTIPLNLFKNEKFY